MTFFNAYKIQTGSSEEDRLRKEAATLGGALYLSPAPDPEGGKGTAQALTQGDLAHTPMPEPWIKRWIRHRWRGGLHGPIRLLQALKERGSLTGQEVAIAPYRPVEADAETVRVARKPSGHKFNDER